MEAWLPQRTVALISAIYSPHIIIQLDPLARSTRKSRNTKFLAITVGQIIQSGKVEFGPLLFPRRQRTYFARPGRPAHGQKMMRQRRTLNVTVVLDPKINEYKTNNPGTGDDHGETSTLAVRSPGGEAS